MCFFASLLPQPNAEASAEAASYGQPIYYNASREVNWTTTSTLDTNLRRLMSLGAEAEGESGDSGCFPAFEDVDSFRLWMSGDYWCGDGLVLRGRDPYRVYFIFTCALPFVHASKSHLNPTSGSNCTMRPATPPASL